MTETYVSDALRKALEEPVTEILKQHWLSVHYDEPGDDGANVIPGTVRSQYPNCEWVIPAVDDPNQAIGAVVWAIGVWTEKEGGEYKGQLPAEGLLLPIAVRPGEAFKVSWREG